MSIRSSLREIPIDDRLGIAIVTGIVIVLGIVTFTIDPYFGMAHHKRGKASMVKSDLRTWATALEAYYVDHGTYPLHVVQPGRGKLKSDLQVPSLAAANLPMLASFVPGSGLTTPVSYATNPFTDRFSDDPNRIYCYWRHPSNDGWIAWSHGPDNDYDLHLGNITEAYHPHGRVPSELMLNHCTYDPTNGTVSNGDIYRTKQ